MLPLAFLLMTLVLFLQNVFFPKFCLLAYAPWIALLIFQCSLPKALWLAALSGAVLDCLSNDPSGVHALNYTAITMLFFRFKHRLMSDHPLHLSLFTAVISLTSTFLQMFLLFLFDRRVPFTGQWAFGDLLILAVGDGLCALLVVALPLFLSKKAYQYGSMYWVRIKQKLFPTSR